MKKRNIECISCKTWDSENRRHKNIVKLFYDDIFEFTYDSHRVTSLHENKVKVSKFNILAKLRKEKQYDRVTLFYHVIYRCPKCFSTDKVLKWTDNAEDIRKLVNWFKKNEIH